jgi:hypothetical protein
MLDVYLIVLQLFDKRLFSTGMVAMAILPLPT